MQQELQFHKETDVVATSNMPGITPDKSFGVITNEQMKKYEFLTRLFSAVIDKSMTAYIVRVKPNILENIRFRKIFTFKCRGITVYSINNTDHTLTAIKLMMSCKLWHPTTLHIIIADSAYANAFKQFCSSSMNVMEYEFENKQFTYCTVEFVDDEAFFFGADDAKQYFSSTFPEIEQV